MAVFGVEVADKKVEVAFLASKVKAARSARVDDLPLGWVELFEERVINNNAEASRFLRIGVVMRPESSSGVDLVVGGSS